MYFLFFSHAGIEIRSTDLEISAISHVPYEGDVDLKIVLHGRKFFEILKEMDLSRLFWIFLIIP